MGETMITASDFQKWLEVFNVVQGAAPTPPFSFPLIGQYGGTGVANTGKTITIGGNLSTVGAFTAAFTMTGNTAVTFPTSGTLATTASASGIVNSGLINQLAYYAAAGTTLSGLATGNDGTLITSAAGLPSISSTLPTTVQTNITRLGVIDQNIRLTPVVGGTRFIILDSGGAGNTGTLNLQAGGGSAGFGGGLIMYGHSHASKPGWVTAGISTASGGRFSVNASGLGSGTELATIDLAASMILGGTGLAGTFRIPSFTAARGSFNITPTNNAADHHNVLVNASTSALRTWTLPDASGTISVLGNAVTGSGSVVLATSPTLVTPVLGVATATSVAASTSITTGVAGTNSGVTVAATASTTANSYNITKTVGGAGGATTFLQLTIPASAVFVAVECLIISSRAVSSNVGTSFLEKRYFTIGRNGSGTDVVLDAATALDLNFTSTTAGGAQNAISGATTIVRNGAEANTAPQVVNITVNTNTTGGSSGTAVIHCTVVSSGSGVTIS